MVNVAARNRSARARSWPRSRSTAWTGRPERAASRSGDRAPEVPDLPDQPAQVDHGEGLGLGEIPGPEVARKAGGGPVPNRATSSGSVPEDDPAPVDPVAQPRPEPVGQRGHPGLADGPGLDAEVGGGLRFGSRA